jgi:hypothetical protein
LAILATGDCGTKEEFYGRNLSVAKILAVGELANRDLSYLADCKDPIIQEINKWMQSLLTSLDFYIWVLQNQMMPESDIGEFLQRSSLMHAVSFFLKTVVNKDMVDVVRSINESLLNTS